MPTLAEIQEFFKADRFASEVTGVTIIDAAPGRSVCQLVLEPRHCNAAGTPQGGAIFTLGDLAFAVAANSFADRVTISLQHDITYFAPARGNILTATASCVRSGRTTCHYTVDFTDDVGTHVASMTVNGFITEKKTENFFPGH